MACAIDSELIATKRFTLNHGNSMPAVGFGSYRIRSGATINNVVECFLTGYRMFDSGDVYHNEVILKNAFQILLPKHDLEREDIFIATKLSSSDHSRIEVVKKLKETLNSHNPLSS